MAIAGMILGISGFVFSWCPFLGFVLALAGIILSALGMKDVTKKGMAITGLIFSILGLVIGLICTICCFACDECAYACAVCEAADELSDYGYSSYYY